MTYDLRYIQAHREEVDPADLAKLPLRQRYTNGYQANTRNAGTILSEAGIAGKNYRGYLYATTKDGDQYPVFINQGRDNGIGADGLNNMLKKEGLTLNQAIERYTAGIVKADDIEFYQMRFYKERHRE